jgi:arginyl-tRNA synthetase
VYYVQYAHARIAKILARSGAEPDPRPTQPLQPAEQALVKKLVSFGAEVAEAAERRAPHRIATYAHELARDFAIFYENCKVVGGDHEPFRLALCEATRRAIARSLDLLGVSAPTEM